MKLKLIVESNLASQFHSWRSREDIPNQVGYKLVVKLLNGLTYLTEVELDAAGLHVLKGIKITDVAFWRVAVSSDFE